MAEEFLHKNENRCYVYVRKRKLKKCNVCHSTLIKKEYIYQKRVKRVKHVVAYCPSCNAFFLNYAVYLNQVEYWKALNSEDELHKINLEYQDRVNQKKEAETKSKKQSAESFHEMARNYKRLIQEKHGEKDSKTRKEREKEKLESIKRKLELKEELRIQQLKEFEKHREEEFNRRLAESRRRSANKRLNIQGEDEHTEDTMASKVKETTQMSTVKHSSSKSNETSDSELRNRLMSSGRLVSAKQAEVNRKAESIKRTKKSQIESGKHEITAHDFVVRSSSTVFRCRNKAHKLQDIRATFKSISRMGTVNTIEIPAGYCPECNVYFILDSTFLKIKQSGVPICRTMDEKAYIRNSVSSGSMDISLAQESVLMQFGYSVSQGEDLPVIQRRTILAAIVDNDVLTKSEIISYLDYFIRYRKNQKNPDGSLKYKVAIGRWKEDREFICDYRIGTYKEVAMKRIIAK